MAWRSLLQYPAQAMFVALAGVCLGGALLMGGIAWRTLDQLHEIGDQARRVAQLQQASGLLDHLVDDARAGSSRPDPEVLAQLRSILGEATGGAPDLPAETRGLDRLEALLASPAGTHPDELESAVTRMGDSVRAEIAAQQRLLSRLQSEARAELETSIGLFAGLAALGLVGAWMMRRRVLRPLADLQVMFSQLAAGDFRPVATGDVHPVLVPLFENYNGLVVRLEHLEKEHRSRAAHLEAEVRRATEALLEQQRALARAERLAAVGEMAASLAHELRNPLAGVQMSLANLRRDLSDPQLAARLELAIAELERLTILLNRQLAGARHVPEPSRPIRLDTLVSDLLSLLRYQVPRDVRIEADVEGDLECVLPRDRLRQALLNLVLNAAQALGEKGGIVRVSARREGHRMQLWVTDDGPGFPAELLEAPGQAFVSRRPGGTGLGLAMVRRLARDLGGELVLENLEPRGARVRLALPCRDA